MPRGYGACTVGSLFPKIYPTPIVDSGRLYIRYVAEFVSNYCLLRDFVAGNDAEYPGDSWRSGSPPLPQRVHAHPHTHCAGVGGGWIGSTGFPHFMENQGSSLMRVGRCSWPLVPSLVTRELGTLPCLPLCILTPHLHAQLSPTQWVPHLCA